MTGSADMLIVERSTPSETSRSQDSPHDANITCNSTQVTPKAVRNKRWWGSKAMYTKDAINPHTYQQCGKPFRDIFKIFFGEVSEFGVVIGNYSLNHAIVEQ